MFHSAKMRSGSIILLALVLLCIPKVTALDLSRKPVVERLIMEVFGPRGLTFPCKHLRNAPQQLKSCLRNLEIRNIFHKAAEVAKTHCQEQFRYYPWGCSSFFGNVSFIKRAGMYRETAVLYAMYSAAFVQTVSRACASGRLKRCSCSKEAETMVQPVWKWRACQDDFTSGRRFTRRFLQLSQKGMDPLDNLVRHNSEVGIQTVGEKMDQVCKCHGIFGSCIWRTCWKRLGNFRSVAQQLKDFYHTARMHKTPNNSGSKKLSPVATKQLFYLEKSPDFCNGTHGRQCENPPNCATLCCGRGYIHQKLLTQHYCDCRWRSNSHDLKCSVCNNMKDTFICK